MSLLTAGIDMGVSTTAAGLRFIGAKKNIQNARRSRSKLKAANAKYLDGFDDLITMIDGAPQMEFDDSAVTEQVSSARQGIVDAQGRVVGDEIMRDSVRQSTADVVSRSGNVGGSTADRLGAISAASADETRAMSQIDAQTSSRRSQNIQAARTRMAGAIREKDNFNRWRSRAEYQDQMSRFGMKMDVTKGKQDAELNSAYSVIEQDNAINSANAALWDFGADSLSSLGTGMGSLIDAYKTKG